MSVPDRSEQWAAGLVGTSIAGKYRVDSVIGTGGMGAILGATQVALGREVAIKVILPHLETHKKFTERFHREARAAAAIGGRGVVAILDFDIDDELGPFLVMERLRGRSLQERLREGPLRTAESVEIIAAMLDTLARVHARSIIHRDIKPANVYLAEDEIEGLTVKLVDFGISRLMDEQQRLTSPGIMLGTPRFMAPEQATGGAVDARTDLYSTGLLLYTCLGYDIPYRGVPAEQLAQAVLAGPPRNLRLVRPRLPDRLYAVVDKAIAHEPQYRYQDAATFASSLREVAVEAGLAIAAPRAVVSSPGVPVGDTATASAAAPPHPSATDPTAARGASVPWGHDATAAATPSARSAPGSEATAAATPSARSAPGYDVTASATPPTRSGPGYDAMGAPTQPGLASNVAPRPPPVLTSNVTVTEPLGSAHKPAEAPLSKKKRSLLFRLVRGCLFTLGAGLFCLVSFTLFSMWLASAESFEDDDLTAPPAQLDVAERAGDVEITYGQGVLSADRGDRWDVTVPVSVRNASDRAVIVTASAFVAPSFLRSARRTTFPDVHTLEPGGELRGELAFSRYFGDPPDAITVRYRDFSRRVPVEVVIE